MTERNYDEDEIQAIGAELALRGVSAKDARRLLAAKTCYVYLNGVA